ncbi:hypothetical protein JKP88DRAFT_276830 [Tribonema minus]|uniref:Uncharacterized protein n=1 Tax=Tribonema minus TaxID=303371 RepID=A0A835Z0A5_9STRA|nr:hypothetical protein JKP88DRAFT_276830 [Tribonema minus]
MADCMRRKRNLSNHTDCLAVKRKYRYSAEQDNFCTRRPFTDDHFLLKLGAAEALTPSQEQIERSTARRAGASSSLVNRAHAAAARLCRTRRCRSQRFMLWTRNSMDHEVGHSHKWYSLHCAFWEAYSLNRTLVLDSFLGMSRIHADEDYNAEVPYPVWYSTKGLERARAGAMFYHDFVRDCGAPGVFHVLSSLVAVLSVCTRDCGAPGVFHVGGRGILATASGAATAAAAVPDVALMPSGSTHADMAARADVPLLVRHWDHDDRSNATRPAFRFGFQVCHPPETADARYPTGAREPGVDYSFPRKLWGKKYAPWVYDMARYILSDMWKDKKPGLKIACIHVRRGDKVELESQKQRYPNLDYDTSPEGIRRTIKPWLNPGSTLYFATNQKDAKAFFAPLEDEYIVRTLEHYSDVLPPEKFLSPSLALVDYAVLIGGCPTLLPTFVSEESRGFGPHLSLSPLPK